MPIHIFLGDQMWDFILNIDYTSLPIYYTMHALIILFYIFQIKENSTS